MKKENSEFKPVVFPFSNWPCVIPVVEWFGKFIVGEEMALQNVTHIATRDAMKGNYSAWYHKLLDMKMKMLWLA